MYLYAHADSFGPYIVISNSIYNCSLVQMHYTISECFIRVYQALNLYKLLSTPTLVATYRM